MHIVRTCVALAVAAAVWFPSDGLSQSISGQGTAARPEHQQISQKLAAIDTGIKDVRRNVSLLLRVVGGSCPGANSFVKAIGTDGSIVCGNVDFPPPPAVASASTGGGGGASGGGGGGAYAPDSSGADNGNSVASGADSGGGGGAIAVMAISGGYFDDMNRWIDTYVPVVLGEGPVTACIQCDYYVDNGAGAMVHPWESFERWAAEQWAAVGVYGIY